MQYEISGDTTTRPYRCELSGGLSGDRARFINIRHLWPSYTAWMICVLFKKTLIKKNDIAFSSKCLSQLWTTTLGKQEDTRKCGWIHHFRVLPPVGATSCILVASSGTYVIRTRCRLSANEVRGLIFQVSKTFVEPILLNSIKRFEISGVSMKYFGWSSESETSSITFLI